jgi:hypothetical protein
MLTDALAYLPNHFKEKLKPPNCDKRYPSTPPGLYPCIFK